LQNGRTGETGGSFPGFLFQEKIQIKVVCSFRRKSRFCFQFIDVVHDEKEFVTLHLFNAVQLSAGGQSTVFIPLSQEFSAG
jgi:hypothetical protein